MLLPAPSPSQANIYSPDRTFYSFKQVVRELNSSCLLVSLHSTSKVSSTPQQQPMATPCQAGPFCHESGTLVLPWTMASAPDIARRMNVAASQLMLLEFTAGRAGQCTVL